MSTRFLVRPLALVVLAVLPLASLGQPLPHRAGVPMVAHPPAAAPLLHARISGPPGLRVTFYQGTVAGQTFDAPVMVGLRPGYLYRVKLTGIADRPSVALFPTIEVRGTLQQPPGQKVAHRAADYPMPIVFTEDDIERALDGVFITQAVVLEDPARAVPVATLPDVPLESHVPPGHDLLEEARQRGRLLAVIRLGGLEVSPEDLARQSVLGTLLLPGDKGVPPARVPPWLPWACWPAGRPYDPILGPRPATEECLQDGGDRGARAGIGPEGRLGGLDPADTVAEFTDNHGQRRVIASNRICICVPRFTLLRTEVVPAGYESIVGLARTGTVKGQALIEARVPSRLTSQQAQPEAMHSRLKPGANLALVGTHSIDHGQPAPVIVGQIEGLGMVGKVQGIGTVSAALDKCGPLHQPLVLCKTADKQAAQVGDVVTFELKYTNRGGQAITDVAVTDSLTGRLEYVFGSARSDRDAVFTIQENDAGSVILRWEIGGRVLPGQGGVIRFQARIR